MIIVLGEVTPEGGWAGVLANTSLPIDFKSYFFLPGLVCAKSTACDGFRFAAIATIFENLTRLGSHRLGSLLPVACHAVHLLNFYWSGFMSVYKLNCMD